ncbi:hypothetical protein [Acidovorax sp. SUPP2539]|uniref:hypothetical protein n=1 Tax=Acidovorax sp. SUPP2539 TaxID=2920878 RepID=UPI0023DE57F1|nr:hypothetical protein [Acidovorax sp. SUPP2539]GKS88679.1 hypothetical protein AVTE2539_04960 [Acidovorax sp. SUPP2539]
MTRFLLAGLLYLTVTTAYAQVQCGNPVSGSDAKYAEDYARNVTRPLIEHNAGGLGPILWAYIAGQARGESLGHMRDQDGNFIPKPNNNLWNVQTPETKECSSTTAVGCLKHNLEKPFAANKEAAPVGQCWSENGNPMQWVKVCFPSYPTLESAADAYLTQRPNYTKDLQSLAKGNPTREAFFNALKGAYWSDQATKPDYKKDTLDAIDRVLQGLATLRQKDTHALAGASAEINAWCAQAGVGDAAERKALSDKQDKLVASLAAVSKVCSAEAGASPPATNPSIGTCRMQAPPPPAPVPAPGGGQAPAGGAKGTGEPHYRLPGGQTLTTQRAGEFWLLDASDGTRIQVRQSPWRESRSVSAISAVAAQVGAHRVHIDVDGRVLIDGKPVAWQRKFVQYPIGRDAALGLWGNGERPSTVAILWTHGRVLRVHLRSSWLDLETGWTQGTRQDGESGLVGRASSTRDGQLIGRTGGKGLLPDRDQADAFVSSWRIAEKDSLFAYGPSQSFATFDLRDFPSAPAQPTAAELEAGRKACAQAGVPLDRLEVCAFDLTVTGNHEFLQSHLSETPPPAPPQPPAKPTNPALKAAFRLDVGHVVETLPNGRLHPITIGAGESRTYRIDANRGNKTVYLHVYTHDLSCLGESDFDGTTPGLQVFNAKGIAVSKAVEICSDTMSENVEPGDYYLVVQGAIAGGPVSFKVEAFAY